MLCGLGGRNETRCHSIPYDLGCSSQLVADGQAMKCDLTASVDHVELIQSDGWLVSRSTVSLHRFTYK